MWITKIFTSWKIGVEEHDGDVKFQAISRNMKVSHLHNEYYAI